MRLWIYISTLTLFGISCKRADDIFKSYGPEITEYRTVGAFDKIKAGEKFDVFLVQDSIKAGQIEITAGKNVIDGYTTKVVGDELQIANDNKFNWVRKLKVRQKVVVYFKDLKAIQIHGSAKFTSLDTIFNNNELRINQGGLEDADLIVNGDYIFIDGTNTGGVNIKGKCFLISASVDDISYVNSIGLKAEKCYLKSFSKDDSFVDAEVVLEITSFGTGDIFYQAAPGAQVKLEEKGSGKILKY